MASTREHAEWLSLLDVSGSFLNLNVLDRVFPNGPDGITSDIRADFRSAYEEWLENQDGQHPDQKIHRAWIEYVLHTILEYDSEDILAEPFISQSFQVMMPNHVSALHPDIVLQDHEDSHATPVMLMTIWNREQDPEKLVKGQEYQISPIEQMVEMLRGTEKEVGLVTNGDKWVLVGAPKGESASWGIWYGELMCDEAVVLRAFISLLRSGRFFGVPENEMLPAMFKESAENQQQTTDQLGYQVREAVEVLVNAIDRVDMDRGRKLLKDIPESVLYESALTVMMRLVFLFSAEERGLLLLGDPVYDENYAVSTLHDQLQAIADKLGEEVLERRYDAWCRLLAVFRAVYGGIDHIDLKLPAYGGSLFDPDRFPFLEGRIKDQPLSEQTLPIEINNRTVLHLLNALQILQERVGGTVMPRRLSFRGLNVEQIGHVYEGLLDHTAKRATETVLSLTGSKDLNAEIPLSILDSEFAKSRKTLFEYLKKRTGRTEKALEKALDTLPDEQRSQRLKTVCNNDESVYKAVLPWSGLIRDDDTGYPCVFLPGSVYVTAGTERRSTGTHYTPRSLTEPVVKYTLEPLVYVGPTEGLPQVEWKLKSPAELLNLKICDMAMGSAGFLVQVIRYLADRLVESWENLARDGQLRITPEGKPALGDLRERLLPLDPEERIILAKRLIADRCIYGVDKNPLAVEIAKLSIWLTTMDKGRPFGFLDHALKCGDSLIGADENDYRSWQNMAFGGSEKSLVDEILNQNIIKARQLRKDLEASTVIDIREVEAKAELAKQADAALRKVKEGCDVLIGAQLSEMKKDERDGLLSNLISEYQAKESMDSYEAQHLIREARKVNAFHWQFEFPEVFEKGGFDAFVGNPPFIGGQHITGNFGIPYRNYIVEKIAKGAKGSADLCSYFLLHAFSMLNPNGNFGFITTNTIAQGDTREVGLDQIKKNRGIIYRANTNTEWPGQAAVYVNLIFVHKGDYLSPCCLNEKLVHNISSKLLEYDEDINPYQLVENQGHSFIGSYILGNGFILSPEEANKILSSNVKNRDVIFPSLNGKDLNDMPEIKPIRYAINFFDWDIEKAKCYHECFSIIKDKVFPERTRKKEDGSFVIRKTYADKWWQYAEKRPALYQALPSYNRFFVCTRVTKYLSFTLIDNHDIVFTEATVIILFDKFSSFTVLQSNFYDYWARKYSSSLGTTLRFSPSDCFDNYPFPRKNEEKREWVGKEFYELRSKIMKDREKGLTEIYNLIHDPNEQSSDIVEMRQLMIEMNLAVRDAYGWQDLDLDQGFHETKEGLRFTISEAARIEVLQRLLKLNHERHNEEVAAGLVSDGKSSKKPPMKKDAAGASASDQKPKTKVQKSAKKQASLPLFPEQVEPTPVQYTFPIEETGKTASSSSGKQSVNSEIGNWDKCVCLGCGKVIAGFMRTSHTRDAHKGKDPGYRKI